MTGDTITWRCVAGTEVVFRSDVRLDLPARTGAAARAETRHETDRPAPPEAYHWTFELRRDERQSLELYFFYGDPGAHGHGAYVLERDL